MRRIAVSASVKHGHLTGGRIVARLERDGWVNVGGKKHDIFRHPTKLGRIVVPRHREQSPGVARSIAMIAGWN
ncbi:MAG: type II toxin-antitoxin system HicA family toxin [Hyphomicrobiaceae bacterium]|nr:type II toxin-antitoxin system HicA family toxin [Hyphomicrobiaceae bacterium]